MMIVIVIMITLSSPSPLSACYPPSISSACRCGRNGRVVRGKDRFLVSDTIGPGKSTSDNPLKRRRVSAVYRHGLHGRWKHSPLSFQLQYIKLQQTVSIHTHQSISQIQCQILRRTIKGGIRTPIDAPHLECLETRLVSDEPGHWIEHRFQIQDVGHIEHLSANFLPFDIHS